MTAKELIAKLERYPADTVVHIGAADVGFGGNVYAEVNGVDKLEDGVVLSSVCMLTADGFTHWEDAR